MPRREREQDPPVDACCGPRLKRVPLDKSLERSSRPTPVPSELTRAVRGASVHDGLGRLKLLTPHATHDLRLEPVERDYMVGWQLGKGSFGTVFVALSRANRRDVRPPSASSRTRTVTSDNKGICCELTMRVFYYNWFAP